MKKVLLVAFLFPFILFAQPEPVNSDHPVYFFLRKASVAGFLTGYDDAILPKSRSEIKLHLEKLREIRKDIPASLREEFDLFSEMFEIDPDKNNGLSTALLLSRSPVHLFKFKGDGFEATIDPLFDLKFHGANDKRFTERTGSYLRYGGYARFNYRDWLSAYVMAWNGNAYGSREINGLDPVVGQKFSFRKTGINNFDGTEGGIFIEKDIFSVSIARNRLLWGENFYNRDKISASSQLFDRFSFTIKTESFSYDYTHAWLVTPQIITPGNVITGDLKSKTSKYTVQNRIAFTLSERLRLSLWQAVIYAGRSPELGYLNPFLFWESAQRSLEDLDNSFLGVDARYRPVDGLEITASLLFDDINFKYWTPGNFQRFNNRFAFNAGLIYIPSFAPALAISSSYYYVRPYTFSHPGAGEDLAYLNNSYPLGLDVKPNSDMVNFRIDWQVIAPLKLSLDLKHTRHGENIYDATGQLTGNHGGSFFISTNALSNEDAYFLAGEFQNTTSADISLHFTSGANTFIKSGFVMRKTNFNDVFPENYFYLSLSYLYF